LSCKAWRGGAALLPQYAFVLDSGEWKHRSRINRSLPGRRWLASLSYSHGRCTLPTPRSTLAPSPALFSDYLAHARSLVAALPTDFNLPDQSRFLGDRWGKLRWFLLPSEALAF